MVFRLYYVESVSFAKISDGFILLFVNPCSSEYEMSVSIALELVANP